jgi:hypothetical protein
MFPFDIRGLKKQCSSTIISNNKSYSVAALAKTNKWVSVLDEDVMAAALAVVHNQRLQKQSVEPETHAHFYSSSLQEATPSFRKERQCHTTAVRALSSGKYTKERQWSEAVPSQSAVELPAELPTQAIAVHRPSLQAERSNTAIRVFSTVTAQAGRYNTTTRVLSAVTAQVEQSSSATTVFSTVTAQPEVSTNQVDGAWVPSFENRRDSAEALRAVQENSNW